MALDKNKIIAYLKRNALSILLWVGVGVVVINTNAKSWMLQKLMLTGVFNAKINQDKAPDSLVDFSISNKDGIVVDAASFRGKVVFVNLWASWCPPCRAEFPSLVNLYKHFKEDDRIVFLFVNEDESKAKAEKYLSDNHILIPQYHRASSFPTTLFSGTLPTTFILSKKGQLIYHHEGLADYDSKQFIYQLTALAKE